MILDPHQWREHLARHGDVSKDQIDSGLRCVLKEITSWPLLIHGDAGAGKTVAALLFLEHWNRDHSGCLFTTCRDFAQRVCDAKLGRLRNRAGYEVSLHELWSEWSRASLTVLDDLGSREKVTDSMYESVWDCLDQRQNQPSIYTSNLGRTELAKVYDDRIVSRLSAGTVVHVTGDLRQRDKAPTVPPRDED